MKKLLTLLMALVVLSVTPFVLAIDVGAGITPDIVTEDFEPQVWMCDGRVVLDDNVEPGRWHLPEPEYIQSVSSYQLFGERLWERSNNYAFEGEKLVWDVLVFDKNGIEKIEDVFATIGDVQGAGNDIEVNCILDHVLSDQSQVYDSCNSRILEEELTSFEDNTAAYYKCILTVETPESMYGEYWLTVEATDLDGLSGTMDENEYWFFNPVIALSIDGDLTFENVRPGASAYSSTLLVGNDADAGSGVLLDMFISGTDFYDSTSSGAKCPLSNQLALGNGDSFCDLGTAFGGPSPANQGFGDPFCYFASNGAYSTQGDVRSDVEGYVGINYGDTFGQEPHGPGDWYGAFNGDPTGYEIVQSTPAGGSLISAPYFNGNVLSPGGEIATTFRLNLPEPCNGDFDTGAIYFWGEAI
jgi:hypothetical protein